MSEQSMTAKDWTCDHLDSCRDCRDVLRSAHNKIAELGAELAEQKLEIAEYKDANNALNSELTDQKLLRDQFFEKTVLLEAELKKVKGCDHLDAPYRKLLEENKRLEAQVEKLDCEAEGLNSQLGLREQEVEKLVKAGREILQVNDSWSREYLEKLLAQLEKEKP